MIQSTIFRSLTVCFVGLFWVSDASAQSNQRSPRGQVEGVELNSPSRRTRSPQVRPSISLADSSLRDIFFVDSQSGWAVGDNGLVLFTNDGGVSWNQGECPVSCCLESVHFVDRNNGWAVGGFTKPIVNHVVGTILRSTDGGKTWRTLPHNQLSRLRKVHFDDLNHGWAIGEGTALYSSGLFTTVDGGNSWSSFSSRKRQSWINASANNSSVVSNQKMNLVSTSGQVVKLSNSTFTSIMPGLTLGKPFRDVQVGPKAGIMVGDDGLVLRIDPNTGRWTQLRENRNSLDSTFDFKTACVKGQDCWVAGSPGAAVYRSHDAGANWQLSRTGFHGRIHRIYFVDSKRGYAAGDFGTILSTIDGGRSWQTSRKAGKSAALLAVSLSSKDVRPEVFSYFSAEKGLICGQLILDKPAGEPSDQLLHQEKVRQALTKSGCTITEFINRDNQYDLSRKLVQAIRQYKPSAILMIDADENSPEVAQLREALSQAIEEAASANQFANQLNSGSLEPFQVRQFWMARNEARIADIAVDPKQFAPNLGSNLEDHAYQSNLLLGSSRENLLNKIAIRPNSSNTRIGTSIHDLSATLGLAKGENSRQVTRVRLGNLEAVKFLSSKEEAFGEFQRFRAEHSKNRRYWRSVVVSSLAGLSKETAGNILFQFHDMYRRTGQYDLAIESLQMLLSNLNNHPLSDAAVVELMTLTSSRELALEKQEWLAPRIEQYKEETSAARLAKDLAIAGSDSQVEQVQYEEEVEPEPELDGPVDPRIDGNNQPRKLSIKDLVMTVTEQNAAENNDQVVAVQSSISQAQIEQLISTRYPHLEKLPQVLFSRTSRLRADPNKLQVELVDRSMNQLLEQNAFNDVAETEKWLMSRKGAVPQSIFTLNQKSVKAPKLDGELNDKIWTETQAIQMTQNQSNQLSGHAQVASDSEYLYLAFIAPNDPTFDYSTNHRQRISDSRSDQIDRFEFQIDTDRDYQTSLNFVVDFRGWVSDSQGTNSGWDPEWFAVTKRYKSHWVAEIAIPLNQLSQIKPAQGDAWSVTFSRQKGKAKMPNLSQRENWRVLLFDAGQ